MRPREVVARGKELLIPRERPVAVAYGSGFRSSVATRMLRRQVGRSSTCWAGCRPGNLSDTQR